MDQTKASLASLCVVALIALAVPTLAAAQTITVDEVGDEQKQFGALCKTPNTEKCSLRAAIELASADTAKDTIVFSGSVFAGGAGSTIAPASPLPQIGQPLLIDGGACTAAGVAVPCVTVKGISGFATISVMASESTVKGLGIDGGSVGIQSLGNGAVKPGAEILGNFISGAGNAIEAAGSIGGSGNLIEGNRIEVPENFNKGIAISNGPNRVFGNLIEGSGCCFSGVFLTQGAEANKIGGDTPVSENVIEGFQNGAISVVTNAPAKNEIARNRGAGNGIFITNNVTGGVAVPTISAALQSSASGTAEPGAKVRLFRMTDAFQGGIDGFLGEAVADGTGSWKAGFATVPVGSFVAATQTSAENTSAVSEVATTAADPPPPSCATVPSLCPPSNGGGSAAGNPPVSPVIPPADTTKPKVTVTSGPKARSTATTAKFRFVSNEAGSSFKCKLDKKAFANCGSPKTYRKLAPGKHVFKLRATDPAGNVSTVLTRRFTVLE